MKRSWIIGVVAVLAVCGLVAWIAPRVYWEEQSVPAPLKGEARTNPFYGAQRLVANLDAHSEWRRSLGTLPSSDAVIFLRYWHWDLIEARRQQLESWVEAGGRLVVDDTLAGGREAFEQWIGVSHGCACSDEDAAEETPEADSAAADEDDCRELEVSRGGSHLRPVGDAYFICGIATTTWLTSEREPIWALDSEEGHQALRVPTGRGSVTVLNASPFESRQLRHPDHAVLLADVLQLRHRDQVLFISDDQHESLLALIWKHGASVVVLLLLLVAMLLWRDSIRFGPLMAAPELSRRSLAEQIRGTGRFVMRAGRGNVLHAAMVRAVHEAARRRIPGYDTLQPAGHIESIGKLTGFASEPLRAALSDAGRSAHELKRAIDLLDRVCRTLTN